MSHPIKLIGRIVLSLQSYGYSAMNGIKRLSKRNPLLSWSSEVESDLWWLFGVLTSHSINAASLIFQG